MTPDLATRYSRITSRISELAGAPGKITLLAVSKTQPPEAIEQLYKLGHRDFGENYAQELIEKAKALETSCPDIRWHFIGHLQTNKVKAILPYVYAVHSVDSERLAEELDKRWRQLHPAQKPLSCFLEVNIDHEPSKSGLAPEATPALAATIASKYGALKLEGLMAIPSSEAPAAAFTALRELELKCRPATAGHLSMGMSADYELAIPLGATHIRVGTALFGARLQR